MPMERYAIGFHLLDGARGDGLFHLGVGKAVNKQSARRGVFTHRCYKTLVAGAHKLLSAAKPPQGPSYRANDGDFKFARFFSGRSG